MYIQYVSTIQYIVINHISNHHFSLIIFQRLGAPQRAGSSGFRTGRRSVSITQPHRSSARLLRTARPMWELPERVNRDALNRRAANLPYHPHVAVVLFTRLLVDDFHRNILSHPLTAVRVQCINVHF